MFNKKVKSEADNAPVQGDAMGVIPVEDERFFRRGRNWEADREQQDAKWGALGWRLFWAAFGMCGIFAICIAVLVARHKPIAFLVDVDKATGETSTIMPLDQDRFSYDEMSVKHDVKRFVLARESYYFPLLQSNYDVTMALSCETVGQEYDKLFQGDKGLDKVLGAGTEWRVKVINVRLPRDEPGKAVVSFEKAVYHGISRDPSPAARYVSTLSYQVHPELKLKEAEWIDNPRGFKVCAYRADPDLVGG